MEKCCGLFGRNPPPTNGLVFVANIRSLISEWCLLGWITDLWFPFSEAIECIHVFVIIYFCFIFAQLVRQCYVRTYFFLPAGDYINLSFRSWSLAWLEKWAMFSSEWCIHSYRFVTVFPRVVHAVSVYKSSGGLAWLARGWKLILRILRWYTEFVDSV